MAVSERRYNADLQSIARYMVRIAHCPAGRPVPYGYVCIHCGHDFTTDDKCGARKRKPRGAV